MRLPRLRLGSENSDREMELVEHLEELRFRIIRSLIYVVVLAAVCWLFYGQLYALLKHPLDAAAGENVSLIYLHVTEAFFLQLQVCCIAGVVFASPLLVWEAWGFVAPALTSDERRPVRFMFPMAVFLFLLGVALSYAILPMGLKWFISYIPAGVELKQKTSDYILFVVKMCGAFGIGFELPVFLMMFAKVGIINSDMMKRYWRESTVVIMIVAAILTPSNDPLSMLMMSIPMVFLFFISIRLVKMVE